MSLRPLLRRLRRRLRAAGRSAVPPALLETIQAGTLRYTYKGVPMLKNPFDMALYPLLIAERKPATVIEIGSNAGGSALWFADLLRLHGRGGEVHSVDIRKVTEVSAPGVTFHEGDARDLGRVFPPERLRALARPLLVIEDADHQAATTLAVLRFFADRLEPGEYLVVEDGIVADMGIGGRFGGGPCAAIERFLAEQKDRFEIDRRYCDWYGRNVTWNVNGFLRRR